MLRTSSTKVLVNGVPGRRICHACRLRQGDLVSLTLFVLGMEVLTAVIKRAVKDELFQPVAGINALHHLSIYADDVVMFVKPAIGDLQAIQGILELFEEVSGLRINYAKSTTTLIRDTDEQSMTFRRFLGAELFCSQ